MTKSKPQIVVVREDSGSGLIPGLLLGAAVGVVAGLLRAPAPGQQLRTQLTARLQGLRQATADRLPSQQRVGTTPADR